MRRNPYKIERVETVASEFAELYRNYTRLCLDEGVEPMRPGELLDLLRAIALADMALDDTLEAATLH